jgi:hypothetical protein
MIKKILLLSFLAQLILPLNMINARTKGLKASRSYAKKAPYAGYGKKSSVNGRYKVKSAAGHYKRTNKGYAYVNSYSRSN